MDQESPAQLPEGRLIYNAQQASGRSIKAVAKQAGMSDARWRQIVKGTMVVQGNTVPVVANPHTLARMANAVGLSAGDLRVVGRDDAAQVLESTDPGEMAPDADPDLVQDAQRNGDERSPVSEQIEMIYRSNMSATEKLQAIRYVLELNEKAGGRGATTLSGTGTLTVGHPRD